MQGQNGIKNRRNCSTQLMDFLRVGFKENEKFSKNFESSLIYYSTKMGVRPRAHTVLVFVKFSVINPIILCKDFQQLCEYEFNIPTS